MNSTSECFDFHALIENSRKNFDVFFSEIQALDWEIKAYLSYGLSNLILGNILSCTTVAALFRQVIKLQDARDSCRAVAPAWLSDTILLAPPQAA